MVWDSSFRVAGVLAMSMAEGTDAPDMVAALERGLPQSGRTTDDPRPAICVDVTRRAPVESDAIQVSIEHAEADPIVVSLPYRKRRLRGIEYGELIAAAGSRRIFAALPGT